MCWCCPCLSKKLCYMCVRGGVSGCDQGGGSKGKPGRAGASTVQDGPVDLQHGTKVNKHLHPCTKGHHPNKGFLHFENPLVNHYILYNTVLILHVFLLCRLNINHVKDP